MIDAAIGWENVTVLRNMISHDSLAVRHVRWQYIVHVNAKNTIGRQDIRRCANMWQRNKSVWKISVLYLEMLNRRILCCFFIDKDKKIPRRNDSLNIDHENCRLDLATCT